MRARPWRRSAWVPILLALSVHTIGARVPAAAQAAPEQQVSTERGPWWLLWSRPSDQDRLLWAMWTAHLHHLDEGISNDRLAGLIRRGGYVGSFRTTHGRRAYTVGIERDWASGGWEHFGGMVGFRAGLVYGYDRRLGWLADLLPILPFAQPVIYGRIGPFTTDLTYTWVVVSLTGGLRL